MRSISILASLALLITQAFASLSPSYTVGPYVIPKQLPRAFASDASDNFVVIGSVDGGCGTLSYQLTATAYFIGSRLQNNTQISWKQDMMCLNATNNFYAGATDPQFKQFYFVANQLTDLNVYSVNSQAYTKVGTLPSGTDTTYLDIAPLTSGGVYVSSASKISNVDSTVTFPPITSTAQFHAIVTDDTSIFATGFDSASSQYFVSRHNIANPSNSPVVTSFTATSQALFASPVAPNDPLFTFRRPIKLCGNNLIVVSTANDGSSVSVHQFDASSANMDLLSSSTLSLTPEAIIDYTCDASNNIFILTRSVIVGPSSLVFNSYLYYYDGSQSLATQTPQKFNVEVGQTIEDVIPPYLGLVMTPRHGLYTHRQTRQSLATGSEAFGTLFTFCSSTQYGSTCAPCTCQNGGVCDNGELGTGLCLSCPTNMLYGPTCANTCSCYVSTLSCQSGILGDGHCFCEDQYATGHDCQTCVDGYFMDTNMKVCSICPVGSYCTGGLKFDCPTNYNQGNFICNAPTPSPTLQPINPITPTSSASPAQSYDIIKRRFNWWPILVGLVLGFLALLLLILAILHYLNKKRQEEDQPQILKENSSNYQPNTQV